MSNTFADRQDQIDALLKSVEEDPIAEQKRILSHARIGMETPGALTPSEVQQVCCALTLHYAQMGIT